MPGERFTATYDNSWRIRTAQFWKTTRKGTFPMTMQRFNTPAAAEAAFYAAFSDRDIDTMTAVWAEGVRSLCIHPGSGLLRGRDAVMQSWVEIFAGAEPPTVEYRLLESLEAADLVVHLVEELVRPSSRPAETANRIVATNVYVHDRDSWRLAEHHASLPLMTRHDSARGERQLH